MTTDNNPNYLKEAAILRLFLLVALVFYHAFAPYSGAWPKIDGIHDVEFYCWFDNYIRSFLLESFVFLSGCVFGHLIEYKGRGVLNGKQLVKNKFMRLIIPSMVFSLLYISIFDDIRQPFFYTIYYVISGTGHLWFLPMLFWCFVVFLIIDELQIQTKYALLLLFLCSLFSYSSLPLQLGAVMYYMFFFYLGYSVHAKIVRLHIFDKPLYTGGAIICFFVFVPVLLWFKQELDSIISINNPMLERLVISTSRHLCRIIYALMGLLMLLAIIRNIVRHKTCPQWIVEIGSMGMGVYIIHQFILKLLYWHTNLAIIFGTYILPWAATIITLILSICFTAAVRQFSFGRILLGQSKFSYHLK